MWGSPFCWKQALFLVLCEFWVLFPSILSWGSPPTTHTQFGGVSSHTCPNQYLAEYSSTDSRHSLCSFSSLVLCDLQIPWLTQTQSCLLSSGAHWALPGFFLLCCGLETLQAISRAILGLNWFVFQLSEILLYMMSNVWKVVVLYILSGFLIVSGRRINSILITPSEADFPGWLLKHK